MKYDEFVDHVAKRAGISDRAEAMKVLVAVGLAEALVAVRLIAACLVSGFPAALVVRLAAAGPLVVVHGGGRAIDAELRARGIQPRFVDGLRVTDAETLDAVA